MYLLKPMHRVISQILKQYNDSKYQYRGFESYLSDMETAHSVCVSDSKTRYKRLNSSTDVDGSVLIWHLGSCGIDFYQSTIHSANFWNIMVLFVLGKTIQLCDLTSF